MSRASDGGLEGNGLRFGRMEWAGAFGDLGTLVPFVLAYMVQVGLDPRGVLFAVGASALVTGLVYRTPMPVQPMKAIGVAATTQTALATPGAVFSAGLITGLIWLLVAVTGLTRVLARLVAPAVVLGLVMGLGLAFMLKGLGMIRSDWLVGVPGLLAALLLLESRLLPAMFVLLAYGVGAALWQSPGLLAELAAVRPGLQLPAWGLGEITWNDAGLAVVLLVLPQLPLTLGNAVLAVTAENNRLFPRRATSHRRVALTTGLLNLFSPAAGGIPVCHGAGGLAAQVRFGARSGGAPVILGSLLLVLTLVFGDAVVLVLKLLPEAVLGVMLLLAGAELAVGALGQRLGRGERWVLLATAATAVWNPAAGLVAGLALDALIRAGLVRFGD